MFDSDGTMLKTVTVPIRPEVLAHPARVDGGYKADVETVVKVEDVPMAGEAEVYFPDGDKVIPMLKWKNEIYGGQRSDKDKERDKKEKESGKAMGD